MPNSARQQPGPGGVGPSPPPPGPGAGSSSLTMDRAVFLLIRIKRVFQKKRRKTAAAPTAEPKPRPPMLRARTLPAIITPALHLIQASWNNASQLASAAGPADYHPSRDLNAAERPAPGPDRPELTAPSLKPDEAFSGSSNWPNCARSGGDSPRHSISSNSSGGSQSVEASAKDNNRATGRNGSLQRLTKLLANRTRMPRSPADLCHGHQVVTPGSGSIKRSGSVDSLCPAEPWADQGLPRPTKLPADDYLKVEHSASPGHRQGLDTGSPRRKRSQRKKLQKFSFDQQALFSAVENENVERTSMILQSTEVDVNSTNSDGFTPLDIAVMLLHLPLIRVLREWGAREGDQFSSPAIRERHLRALLTEAQLRVSDLALLVEGPLLAATGSSGPGAGLSSAMAKEKERQLAFWRRRIRLLDRLFTGFQCLQRPAPPLSIHVEVVAADSLLVHFYPPLRVQERGHTVITKYQVQWSSDQFDTVLGSALIRDLSGRNQFLIGHLQPEQAYQVRVASGNCKGFSEPCYPLLDRFVPSSWRALVRLEQFADKRPEMDQLLGRIVQEQLGDLELPEGPPTPSGRSPGAPGPPPPHQPRKVRKSLRNFFAGSTRFQKALKRSAVYLAALVYHQDRVLVTNEEVLPVIEIDDSYPGSLQQDFHWLLKVSCCWQDTRTLRQQLDKSQWSPVTQLRAKMLWAVEQMQSSLKMPELGKLFYRTLRDSEHTVLLCTVRCVSDAKLVSCLSVRWMPMQKLRKRMLQQLNRENAAETPLPELSSPTPPTRFIGHLLLTGMDEMIQYHEAGPLPPGLYLAYLKLQSSVDLLSVMVARRWPNMLPCAKVRDNGHVSRHEWQALHLCHRADSDDLFGLVCPACQAGTGHRHSLADKLAVQQLVQFLQQLCRTATGLLRSVGVPEPAAAAVRIYTGQVVELEPLSRLSLILLVPGPEQLCTVTQSQQPCDRVTTTGTDTDLLYLPLRTFELIHMQTYQAERASRYARTSALLELDILAAQHAAREAFSADELLLAKTRLDRLLEWQGQLDQCCRSMRWITEVVARARGQRAGPAPAGVSLGQLEQCLARTRQDGRLLLNDAPVPRSPPMIKVQGECSSAPSSPPQSPALARGMARRHSRDDSYLQPLAPGPAASSLLSLHHYELQPAKSSQERSHSLTEQDRGDAGTAAADMRRCASTAGVFLTATTSADLSNPGIQRACCVSGQQLAQQQPRCSEPGSLARLLCPRTASVAPGHRVLHVHVAPCGPVLPVQVESGALVADVIGAVVRQPAAPGHYWLCARYRQHVKHLDADFAIGQLQSPWDRAVLLLNFAPVSGQ